ncbi:MULTISPECIES: FAD-binding oxidoreductase [unclassified Burkholderia]|uniref:FAD-binding oxidoreductase n=1 Tax=unclassified Burkholderia TaxID=2613784 RepID=UPI001420B6E3|nr:MULTISPECIES: FAD-binding oxidoreductase [unclassified Burkholderia]NIE57090.1 FAD-binding oxidoreductase [Burkholderia sp. Ap-955]NIF10794.1 FAD-binding oxidoreductase [Burkholderia sp. Ax-1735]NIG05951.1 FAD-binding oxidoreductase [Burkholderia sp. Tr-849]
MSTTGLRSWARYPRHPQTGAPVYWRDSLPALLSGLSGRRASVLAYGNGRSYGDSCLAVSDQVLWMKSLDRFIDVDWQTGRIRAEAGMTLDVLLDAALPRGWMLPVTPGTRYVTLGGALANDVHGKNHHIRGTFGRHVTRFGLVRSDLGPLEIDARSHPELYAATIGGLGLTGVISWVELQLMQVPSARVDLRQMRFGGLDEFFALSNEHDARHEYSVAWIDCGSRGKALGRGVLTVADAAPAETRGQSEQDGGKGNAAGRSGMRSRPSTRQLAVPFTPPFSLVNRLSVPAFNALHYWRAGRAAGSARVDLLPFLYPLDGLLEWHRIYGRRGFQQYQCVVPAADARDAIGEMLAAIAASRAGSFLAVLKRCGALVSPGLLSFPLEGTSLALDFAQHDARNAALFARLDAIVRGARGRLYPAKDAHMSGEDFRRAYPAWTRVEALRDPAIQSRFWQRTTKT